ncbi:hypothetical protein DMB66_08615 [Actinoplanes sp. ATCC 53533]|uniref:hypothetical protein n=1 Tax=Actinoplanes sp. ATCC 53533 TaxID=1288362 RepID=UPI000F77D99C|nr:hypothetical protein [Actinoplanes sp. ATCC 53533]RSM70537.1 hypothetical protein DMB66_08615 [Actinoplanes sp. ATCC 53533]
MIWTGRADEAAALGLLLDRTYADAAAAAEHPRLLDREFLIGQFDLWDDHLLPAVAAGSASLRTRRATARAVWRRLGFVAGADHRAWMADHLDGLGLDPGALLGPAWHDRRPFRSQDGRLLPAAQPLTGASTALINADYDLAGGGVEGARMELSGPDLSRIGGFLKLSAGGRRYPAAAGAPPELHFRFGTATTFGFPHAERGSVRLSGPPSVEMTPDGVSLGVPASPMDLRLAARGVTWYPLDDLWHESAAARDADAGAYESGPELPEHRSPAGPAGTLQVLQFLIMRQLRMMRYAGQLRRWELAAAGSLCRGINAELFRVRPAALRSRTAARRLRSMMETDDGLSRAFLRRTGREMRLDVPGVPGAVPPTPVRITVGTAGRLLDALDFTAGRLRLVDVVADRTVIHLDACHAGRDTIVILVLDEPQGCAPLTVTPDGLALARRPVLAATADDISLTIPLPGGDWTARAAAGSCYVD